MIAKVLNTNSGESRTSPVPSSATTKPDAASVPLEGNQTAAAAGVQPVDAADSDNQPDTIPTKMSKAKEVYLRMNKRKGITRKEIVAAFVEEANLSVAGAATYYQLIKRNRSRSRDQ